MSIIKINKRVTRLLGVAAMALLLTVGCNANKPKPDNTDPGLTMSDAAPKGSSVEMISVVRMGGAVLIEADGSFLHTSFMLTDPSRIFIDMADVNIEKVAGSIDVASEYVNSIEASSYGEADEKIGRIEIGLNEGVSYEVRSGEDSLLVEFSMVIEASEEAIGVPAVDEGVDLGPWDIGGADDDEVVVEEDTGFDEQVYVEPTPDESVMEAATTIVDVKFSNEGGNAVIRIITDGEIGNYNAFGLDDPTRVVVDVWGVDSSLYDDVIEADSDILDRVRLGSHVDKVRLVFDSSNVKVPYYSVNKDGKVLIVTLSNEPMQIMETFASSEQSSVDEQFVETSWDLPIEEEVEEADVSSAEPEMAEMEEVSSETADAEESFESLEFVETEPTGDEPQEALEIAQEFETDMDDSVAASVVEEVVEAASTVIEESAADEDFQAEAYEPAVQEDVRKIVRKASVDVQDVQFRLMGDVARLTITNSDAARFRIKESEDGKVINIDIFNAFIVDRLKSTLDATALGTPVATISSYQAYTEPVGSVRIIVKLSERVPYDIMRDGNAINVDFPLMTWVQKDRDEVKGVIDDDVLGIEESDDARQGGLRYTGRRINIDMVDAEVTDMLKLLAEVSDLNIIASDEVKGSITLRLKDVPWDQAFDLILKIKGLASIQDGNVVRVAPASRIREERESVLASKKAAIKLEDMTTEYIRINYDKAAALSTQLETLLSDRGSITVHEPTNTIIVRDISSSIEDIQGYIDKVDIPIQQVLIEARIVEATSSFARDLGVQWGIDFRNTGTDFTTSSFGSSENFGQWAPVPVNSTGTLESGGVYNVDKENFLSDVGVTNYAVNLPATGTAGTLGALGFILGKTGANPMILDLRISAGEQQGLVKTISRPRIITMNNKEAKIEQGESIPFETSTVDGSATTFIDANLSLIVKPQITPDGSVLMEIKASRNSIGSFRNSAGEPSINRKEASTHVLVRNGETTVMGGIIVSDTNNSERGIPFAKEIPVLGWLFKSKSITDSQTELLIFITPTILNRDDGGG